MSGKIQKDFGLRKISKSKEKVLSSNLYERAKTQREKKERLVYEKYKNIEEVIMKDKPKINKNAS
jgi:hypothetical protein